MSSRIKKSAIKRLMPVGLAVFMLFALITYTPPEAAAYTQTLGDVISASVNGDFITLTIDNGSEPGDDLLELQVCESDILRANYRPNGIASSPSTPIIDPDQTWGPVGAVIDTNSNPMTISTPDMLIEIKKYPCRMTVKKADGTTLFWEPDNGGVYYEGVRFVRNPGHSMYGLHSYEANNSADDILRDETEGRPVTAGAQGDSGGPFMWSTAGYGLLVDADGGWPVLTNNGNKMEYYYGQDVHATGRRYYKDNVEYYIMLGNPEGVMENYAQITGESPMMPEWSLGFSNYEWGINQDELYAMIEGYRARNIPLDSYGLDYDWKFQGEDNYGEFTWNTVNFPQAATTQLKENLDALGVKLIGITKPRIVVETANGTRTQQGNYAETHNFFYPNHPEYRDYAHPVRVHSIDPYNPDLRDWFWTNTIDAFNKGIVGFWNDETDRVDSDGVRVWFGNYSTTHMSQAYYEGQRDYTNDSLRVWQTARTYYPGAQRYATTLWSGDVGIQFKHNQPYDAFTGLDDQKAIMLSSVNLGQAKWGSDGGGFQNYGDDYGNNNHHPTPELYARWLQFAAVSPVFRVHGKFNHQRQPWYYGFTAEEATKAAIQWRYSLMPYMYSYEYKALEKGVGLVKPLMYDYPDDPIAANYVDAWMFGDWLLVAPVTDQYETTKRIYLPAGRWIDYNTGIVYEGGQYYAYDIDNTTMSDLPTFIKEGAIIPTQKVLDYTSEEDVTEVMIDVFASSSGSSFNLYDDDGASYDYEDGAYFKQVITATDNGPAGVSVNVGAVSGSYASAYRDYIFKIHGIAASSVKQPGNMTQYPDLNALRAASGEGYAVGKDIYGDVTYVKVNAGTSKNFTASGNAPVFADGAWYEAEDASLWGASTTQQAKVNDNHPGYTGTGFADGFEYSGAAVTFYAKTKSGGDFPVEIRYANGDAESKTMSIYVNGVYAAQALFAPTSSWSSWSTATQTLPLTSGANTITIRYDHENGDKGFMNIDNIFVPFYATVASYEAESAALHNGPSRKTDHWFYSGSGFVAGMENAGTAVEFNAVDVPDAGLYEVQLRYANGDSMSRTLNVYINGTYHTTATLPNTGDWNGWGTWTQTLPLQAGQNEISFKFDSGNTGFVNLDRLDVKLASGANLTGVNMLDNGGFERPGWDTSNWAEWHPWGQEVAYGVDDGSFILPPESAREGYNRAYFYLNAPYQQSIHQQVGAANGTYRVEFWARNTGNAPYIARAEIAGSTTTFADISQSTEWKHYIIDGIAANGIIDVGFYVDSPGGTVVHIDGVRLIRVS